ncbi:MAG: hypothetical protein HXX13_14120 [Bacteroidetes bacterium]|nr:hypothetical protein [Bacteroidota bacterium]
MKKLLTVSMAFTLLMLLSCSKSDRYNSSILVSEISKVLPSQERLYVPTMGNYLKFVTEGDSLFGFYTVLSQDICLACNQSYQEVLIEFGSDEVLALPVNALIGRMGTWKRPDVLRLDNFAGKGSMYIGFRTNVNNTADESHWTYGWIRIELTQDKINLEVMQSAINLKTNEGIEAGQVSND